MRKCSAFFTVGSFVSTLYFWGQQRHCGCQDSAVSRSVALLALFTFGSNNDIVDVKTVQ